jgi:ABC-type multidrug transport system fused ATPase/permease subunit
VAHHLKTVATFDKIIVMDSEKIVEQGSPRELYMAKGVFHGLLMSSEDSDSLVAKITRRSQV